MTFIRLASACIPLILGMHSAHAAEVYFSFNHIEGGGAARIAIDDATGKIDAIEVLGDVTTFADPKKLAVTGNGQFLILTSDEHELAHIHPLTTSGAAPQTLTLPATTEDVTPADDAFFLTLGKGRFAILNPANGNFTWTWNCRSELDPPGHKGEGTIILADGRTAITSFQKDSSTRKGSRLGVFALDDPRFLHDIQLPRERPDLHIQGSDKEQGPNPELLFTAATSNTLVYSMDLYGGLGFTDLYAAINHGRLENHTRIATSLDGSWGSSFPDRGTLFKHNNRELLLISNASKNGGYVLVDVAAREILQRFPSPSGGEHPVWMPHANLLASAPSGKIKSRGDTELEKISKPTPELHWFNVAPMHHAQPVEFTKSALDSPVAAMTRAGRHLIVFTHASDAIVFDPETREILDRKTTPGPAVRVAILRE